MKDIERQEERGELERLPKQEAANLRRELERLQRTLGGMRDMTQLPAAIFVIDPKREHLAMAEAQKLKIPVIAITDTNVESGSGRTTSSRAMTTRSAPFAC